jgi:hypothetical protein
MDGQAPPAQRDGCRLVVTVELGAGALVCLDDGDPPTLVIDTGRGRIVIEPAAVDVSMLVVLAELVAAAEAMRASVSGRVLGGATCAAPEP